MKPETQDKLQSIVVAVITHFKTLNSVGKGVVDVAMLSSQVVNYLIERNEIKSNERNDCCDHILRLINQTMNNAMPNQHISLIKNEMLNQQSYNLQQVLIIKNKI